MSTDPLAEALGGDAPALPSLDGTERRELATLVERACATQSAALGVAIDEGLRAIPRPLRGLVKKVLFR